MLISLKYNFVLLAMPKCASTALHTALAKRCDIVFGGSPQLKHISYRVYEQRVLPLIAERFRGPVVCEPFSLFREPLSWLSSWYRFRMRSRLAAPRNGATRKTYTGKVSFEQFLHEHFRAKPSNFARVGRQSQFIESLNGRHDAVSLYRHEDIQALVAELERRLGRQLRLPTKNESPRIGFDLSQDQIAEARSALSLEYDIYDRIPWRAPGCKEPGGIAEHPSR